MASTSGSRVPVPDILDAAILRIALWPTCLQILTVVFTEEEDEIDPLDAFMLGNNAAGAAQQQQAAVKPDPDSKATGVPPSRPPLAGGPAVNGKVKRAPVRRGKRSMYDTSSSSEEEEEEEQSDEEDDEVCVTSASLSHLPGVLVIRFTSKHGMGPRHVELLAAPKHDLYMISRASGSVIGFQ